MGAHTLDAHLGGCMGGIGGVCGGYFDGYQVHDQINLRGRRVSRREGGLAVTSPPEVRVIDMDMDIRT